MRGKRVVLGAVALLTLLGARPGPAGAEELCTNRVFDDAARLGILRQAVDQTTTTLAQAAKADVYVRVLARVPGADLDAWQAELERRCPNWQNGAGGRAPGLVVVAVAVDDRKTGIYYGEQWRAALDPKWQAIQDNAMNPRFKEGDIGGGVLAGLAEVTAAIAASPAAPASPVFRDEPGFDDLRNLVPDDDGLNPFPGLFIVFALIAGVVAFGRHVLGGGRYGDDDADTTLHRRYGWRGRRQSVVDDEDEDASSGSWGGDFGGGSSSSSSGSSSSSSGSSSSGGGGGSTSW